MEFFFYNRLLNPGQSYLNFSKEKENILKGSNFLIKSKYNENKLIISKRIEEKFFN